MANIPIWEGSSSFDPGKTPFGFYDNDFQFQTDADRVGGIEDEFRLLKRADGLYWETSPIKTIVTRRVITMFLELNTIGHQPHE